MPNRMTENCFRATWDLYRQCVEAFSTATTLAFCCNGFQEVAASERSEQAAILDVGNSNAMLNNCWRLLVAVNLHGRPTIESRRAA